MSEYRAMEGAHRDLDMAWHAVDGSHVNTDGQPTFFHQNAFNSLEPVG